jgi:hypothetical protein
MNEPSFSANSWNQQPALEQRFETALRNNTCGRIFLDFARFPTANVSALTDGYSVDLRDSRFNLQLHATLDSSMNVTYCNVSWF